VESPQPILRPSHAPLSAYYGSDDNRRTWVLDLFDRTAGDYDRIERIMALGSGSWYRRRALERAGLTRGMTVMDVGTGTGLTASAAARVVGNPANVTGVDPSAGMVGKARVPPGVRLAAGSAESIPMASAAVDFLCMGYALRHIDLPVALREFSRVLKPRGRLCLLEISRPEGVCTRALLKLYLRGVVPCVASLVARHRAMPTLMRYYWDTIEACIPSDAILQAMRDAGFVDVSRHVELGIFSEYCASKPAQ
jgi:demethylmenaquinone methyltransferase/2-methoxy-6-polyprenyl-1,4-benzoquinol methylase